MTDTSPIHFIHIRLEQPQPSLLYPPEVNAYGGFTVAYRANVDTNAIEYVVVPVSIKDRYVKKIGREFSTIKLLDPNTQPNIITAESIIDLIGLQYVLSKQLINKLTVLDLNRIGIIQTIMVQLEVTTFIGLKHNIYRNA
jgi:hypothetical protein